MLALLNQAVAVVTIDEPVAVRWMRNRFGDTWRTVRKARRMIFLRSISILLWKRAADENKLTHITSGTARVIAILFLLIPMLAASTSHQMRVAVHADVILVAIFSRKENRLVRIPWAFRIPVIGNRRVRVWKLFVTNRVSLDS